MELSRELAGASAAPLTENVPLAPLTTWRVGGPARYVIAPFPDEVPSLIEISARHGLAWRIVGLGSNLLVSDNGFDGLVILTRRNMASGGVDGDLIVAGAGAPLPSIARLAADRGAGGFEGLVAIPGSVGGGVAMNCGTSQFAPFQIRDLLHSVTIVDGAGVSRQVRDLSALSFGNRESSIVTGGCAVLSATFRMATASGPAEARAAMRGVLKARRRKFPLSAATAGSTFKNPGSAGPGAERSAGWYLDRAGLKGLAMGGAAVSLVHANWIENRGGATAADVTRLILAMRQRVLQEFGVLLEPEVHELGQAELGSARASGAAQADMSAATPVT